MERTIRAQNSDDGGEFGSLRSSRLGNQCCSQSGNLGSSDLGITFCINSYIISFFFLRKAYSVLKYSCFPLSPWIYLFF